MSKTREMIREALFSDVTMEAGVQPSILMHKNINHDQVAEYTSCCVNEPWREKLKEFMGDGWVVFRIQTEFGINGHDTLAYLAKMKTS